MWLSIISQSVLSFCPNVTIEYLVHYQLWPVLAGLTSVPVLHNSWLAMSNICGSPQSGWMPGWIMHQGSTAGGDTHRSALPLLVSGPVTRYKTIHENTSKCTPGSIMHTAGCGHLKWPFTKKVHLYKSALKMCSNVEAQTWESSVFVHTFFCIYVLMNEAQYF